MHFSAFPPAIYEQAPASRPSCNPQTPHVAHPQQVHLLQRLCGAIWRERGQTSLRRGSSGRTPLKSPSRLLVSACPTADWAAWLLATLFFWQRCNWASFSVIGPFLMGAAFCLLPVASDGGPCCDCPAFLESNPSGSQAKAPPPLQTCDPNPPPFSHATTPFALLQNLDFTIPPTATDADPSPKEHV